ncbi:ATP-binding protein [Nordella sp. HKS 07]|uniref:ATP-binding protein n=1 Tax=Nordella sp. HKS 07 TaxID=2712222 RepID=UPI001FEF504F|nr:ATP-binding protein [Nordella sp. HKS 07]
MMIWPWKKTNGTAAAAADLRERNSAEDALTALIGALPDPVMLLDDHGLVRAANVRAKDLLNMDPVGQHLSSAIRSPAILEAVQNVLEHGGELRVNYEQHVPVPRHFEAFVAAMNVIGPEAAALVLLKDLTREQQTERMRADFVAHASHELRTPLASLLGFIETLQGAAKNDEASRERFLALMQTQAERMKRLIADLLSLSRIEMNAHQRPTGTADLHQIALHVRDTLAGLAKDAGVEIKIDDTDPLLVQGDWDELVQVIQNLVENAIKYAASGKLIEISGKRVGEDCELEVRDHGPGIAEEHLPRLTERFYRTNAQESRSRGGTGLGLAIVKHILNRHRGKLRIQSELGAGSSFVIRVPAVK